MVVESSSYPIIPGLTDDAAELCLSKIPRSSFQITSQVCRRWRSFLKSKHFAAFRKLTGMVEEFLCVLMESECGRDVYWEVFDASGNKLGQIPPVPGPLKRGFGVAVLDGGKIVLIGGYTEVDGSGINSTTVSASADVYEFDPAANSWKKLADMNIPRYNFAFAEVNGLLYVIRGYSTDAYSLSNAEVYNPKTNQWSLMDCPNRPVWRGFAFSFRSKLYAVGNGSRFIDIYDPKTQTWQKLNSEQPVSVYSYTVVRNKVYFMDRNMPGCLGVFDPEENSWSSVFVPPREGGFWVRLGVWNDKLLLFSRVCGHETLMYDLNDKEKGSKWRVCDQIKPSASQLTSVLIEL
ncbi:putative F-box/kelch-repeat protein At1g27420 [Capsella rubella]|uniref:putative F-box/kelch-repeat protein At1g27420 n=1 Tax=Capsella rubella TaxID=81985 RepID=UPI000CD5663C|nr:putative F-box/kelch-repeat protein At1g27420 [Capsella rubella]